MMASSKMVVSTTNSDLPHRESSICSLSTLMADDDDQNDEQQSMTMDDILKNIYTTATTTTTTNDMDDNNHHHAEPRTVDEVWKEIVAGGVGVEEAAAEGEGGGDQVRAAAPEEMTLEDFLTRAGAVREDDVTVGAGGVQIGYGQFQVQPPPAPAQGQVGYGNGTTTSTSGGGGGGGGGGRAGKRRAVQEAPLDKATQQKQRRMIKNRESAARSRERKQAYTVELESLVTQLEEENARLVREEAEQKKERFKRLMENLIPIVEQRRPPRVLRRVHSVHW
ncbi:PREDICTED: G-box-binding factor 4-like [Prunus mume]|uniref:G-box-binding factor 4-like n=1 Tax=Prunus mume TaxID=102107 RepID=A0ABM0N382_PRUMU|nr:PREDICTED: G-box-binding factor 4-like [Prunus mume]